MIALSLSRTRPACAAGLPPVSEPNSRSNPMSNCFSGYSNVTPKPATSKTPVLLPPPPQPAATSGAPRTSTSRARRRRTTASLAAGPAGLPSVESLERSERLPARVFDDVPGVGCRLAVEEVLDRSVEEDDNAASAAFGLRDGDGVFVAGQAAEDDGPAAELSARELRDHAVHLRLHRRDVRVCHGPAQLVA